MKYPSTRKQYLADRKQSQSRNLLNAHVSLVCGMIFRVHGRSANRDEIVQAAELWLQSRPHLDATPEQAAVHEAGHFIAYEVEGMLAWSAEIYGSARSAAGRASAGDEAPVGPTWATSKGLVGVGRAILAGPLAEGLLQDGDVFSSLGELMEARVLIARAAALDGRGEDALWRLTLEETVQLVFHFEPQIRACADLLVAKKRIHRRQPATRRILQQVGRRTMRKGLSERAAALVTQVITANIPAAGPA